MPCFELFIHGPNRKAVAPSVCRILSWRTLSLGLSIVLTVGLALGLLACAAPASPTALDTLSPKAWTDTQERAQRRLVLALAYFEQGQNEVALQEVRAALKIDPSHAPAYNLLGLLHQTNQAPALAEQSFAASIYWAKQQGQGADLADAQHNLGWLLCEQGAYARAQAEFEHALQQPLYRQQAKTHLTSGLCHSRAGQADAARAHWQQALAFDPANPVVRYQWALMEWQSRPEVADNLLAPLHAQQLGNAESLWLGVRVARALDKRDAMQQLGQQLQQRYPHSVQTQAWIQRKFDPQ